MVPNMWFHNKTSTMVSGVWFMVYYLAVYDPQVQQSNQQCWMVKPPFQTMLGERNQTRQYHSSSPSLFYSYSPKKKYSDNSDTKVTPPFTHSFTNSELIHPKRITQQIPPNPTMFSKIRVVIPLHNSLKKNHPKKITQKRITQQFTQPLKRSRSSPRSSSSRSPGARAPARCSSAPSFPGWAADPWSLQGISKNWRNSVKIMGIVWGIYMLYGDIMGIYGDIMGMYGDIIGIYGDFHTMMRISMILWWAYHDISSYDGIVSRFTTGRVPNSGGFNASPSNIFSHSGHPEKKERNKTWLTTKCAKCRPTFAFSCVKKHAEVIYVRNCPKSWGLPVLIHL